MMALLDAGNSPRYAAGRLPINQSSASRVGRRFREDGQHTQEEEDKA